MDKLIIETLLNCEQGVTKRLDENRELFELLQNEAPEFLSKFPWIKGWLESQDRFLEQLAYGLEKEVDEPFRPASKDKPDYSSTHATPMTDINSTRVPGQQPVTIEIDSKNHWYIRFWGPKNETTIFGPEDQTMLKLLGEPSKQLQITDIETEYGSIHTYLETKSNSPIFFRKRLRFSHHQEFKQFREAYFSESQLS
jgi:hypothetical protein